MIRMNVKEGAAGMYTRNQTIIFKPTRFETGVNEMSRGRLNDPGPSDIYQTNKRLTKEDKEQGNPRFRIFFWKT